MVSNKHKKQIKEKKLGWRSLMRLYPNIFTNRNQANRYIKNLREEKKVKVERRKNKSGETIKTDWNDRIKTLEDLKRQCDIDEEQFYIADYIQNYREIPLKITDDEGNLTSELKQVYQVKATLKVRPEKQKLKNITKEVEDLKKDIENLNIHSYYLDSVQEGKLLEIMMPDIHFGKLSDYNETSDTYNKEIARSRVKESLKKFINEAEYISKVVFPIGNDLIHVDNTENSTTAGTRQDTDTMWYTLFRYVRQAMIEFIIELRNELEVPIDIIMIPGNHDFQTTFYLGDVLEAYFKNDPTINIDNSASPRKYYLWGNSCIGFTHGNEEKEHSLPLLMTEEVQNIGDYKFREWHTGHYHSEHSKDFLKSTQSYNSTKIRQIPCISSKSSWENKKGYNSQKSAMAFVWNKEEGVDKIIYKNF